jgi:hypothetical protein
VDSNNLCTGSKLIYELFLSRHGHSVFQRRHRWLFVIDVFEKEGIRNEND